jgi:hypothetical protein
MGRNSWDADWISPSLVESIFLSFTLVETLFEETLRRN